METTNKDVSEVSYGTEKRELGEIINYAIAAYKNDISEDKIFTTRPTDANGYMAAFIERAITHHFGLVAALKQLRTDTAKVNRSHDVEHLLHQIDAAIAVVGKA